MKQTVQIYLTGCRRPALVESEATVKPPTLVEVHEFLQHLRACHLVPVIVGSVAVYQQLDARRRAKFRPTHDVDVFVRGKLPAPLLGWTRDRTAVGVTSWISPSGGRVDFLEAGHEFPDGQRVPQSIQVDVIDGLPVAGKLDLIKLKLASFREHDLFDVMQLVRSMGVVPTDTELAPLNQIQRENLSLIRTWAALQPEA